MEKKRFDKGYYRKLDQLVNVAFANLCTISKEDKIVRLSNVDFDNDKHWAVLNILGFVCRIMEREAYLDMPFFAYLRMQRKLKNKHFKRVKNNGGMDLDKFIFDIEDANKSLMTDPFLDIAHNYYPREREEDYENLH